MDKGLTAGASGTPANSNPIGYWGDKSGAAHHAKVYQSNNNYKPKYYTAGMNGKPTVQFDGSNDYLLLDNGRTDFHMWNEFTILIVYEDWGSANWRAPFGNVDQQTGDFDWSGEMPVIAE